MQKFKTKIESGLKKEREDIIFFFFEKLGEQSENLKIRKVNIFFFLNEKNENLENNPKKIRKVNIFFF